MSYDKKTGLYTGYIYKIENDINHKLYVGQTRHTLRNRWSTFASAVRRNRQDSGDLVRAMQALGIEHFHQSEICSKSFTSLEEEIAWLKVQEKYYIKLYDLNNPEKGYNIQIGGLDDYGREYVQYDLNGNHIATYRYSTLPKKYDRISVLGVCIGDKYTAFGYIWRFGGDAFDKYPMPTDLARTRSEGRKVNQTKKVIQYDLTGKVIRVFLNPIEAAKAFNTRPQVIKNACTGITHTFKESIFRFEGDAFDKYGDVKDIRMFNGQNRGIRAHEIFMYDQYGELVEHYPVLHQLCKDYNLGHGAVEERLKNGEPLINGEKAYLFSPSSLSKEEVLSRFEDKYKVYVYNEDGTLFGKYFSYLMASKDVDVSSTSLQYYLKGKTASIRSKYKYYTSPLKEKIS